MLQEVLEALAQHVLAGMGPALEGAVRARPDLADRLPVVLATMAGLSARIPYIDVRVEAESAFALAFFRRAMPDLRNVLEPILAPVLLTSPPVASGAVSAAELCELFERVILSTNLVRTQRSDLLPGLVAELRRSLTEHDRRRRRLTNG